MNTDELTEMLWNRGDAECAAHLADGGTIQSIPLNDRWELANVAAFCGHRLTADILLASIPSGTAPSVLAKGTSTPLLEAIYGRHFGIAADIYRRIDLRTLPDERGTTPLRALANARALGEWNEDADRLQVLLLRDGCQPTSVPEAAALFDIKDVKRLVAGGADPDDRIEPSERTAVHIAVLYDDIPLLEYLLSLNPPFDRNDSFRYSKQVVSADNNDLNDVTPIDLVRSERAMALLKAHGAMTKQEKRDIEACGSMPWRLIEEIEKRPQQQGGGYSPPATRSPKPTP